MRRDTDGTPRESIPRLAVSQALTRATAERALLLRINLVDAIPDTFATVLNVMGDLTAATLATRFAVLGETES